MKPALQVSKIITDQLVIRVYKVSDAVMLTKSIAESVEHLKPWMPWMAGEPETVEAKEERIIKFIAAYEKGEDCTMGIFNPDEDEVLGSTGFHARLEDNALEIGYWVNVRHIGKGLATEAVRALTQVGFEINHLDRIEIHCDIHNKASALIPERCGYQLREVQMAVRIDTKGNVSDTMIWQMTKEQYFSKPFDIGMQAFDKGGKQIME